MCISCRDLCHCIVYVYSPCFFWGLYLSNVNGISFSKLAKSIVSPTAYTSIFKQGTSMLCTSRNLSHDTTNLNIPCIYWECFITDIVCIAITKATIFSFTPAAYFPGSQQRAGMIISSRDLSDSITYWYVSG